MAGKSEELGSLAQSTRQNHLGQTRTTLLVIGVLTLLINGGMFLNSQKEVEQVAVAPGDFDRVLLFVRMIYGVAMAVGAYFILAGLLVKKYPLPMTITSLILYLAATAGIALLNPMLLAQGIIFKVIIIVGLVKSVQTAWNYQNEKETSLDVEE